MPTIDEIKEILFVKYKRVSIMVLILVALIVITIMSAKSFNASERDAAEAYSKYVSSLYADKNTSTSKQNKTVIIPAEDTVDIDKINADIETADAILTEIFTFENGEQYDASRDKLIGMFGEDSEIVQSVFTVNDKTEVDGQVYNYVDLHKINMKTTDVRTYPLDINDNGNNRYISFVSFSITTDDNQSVSYMLSTLYNIDEYGSMIDCNVYLLRNKH